MATKQRWKKAQEYEQGFWERAAQRAAEGSYDQLDFYEWRAGEIQKRLASLGQGQEMLFDGSRRFVELGSGPIGVLGFLPAQERAAVDPLNHFYGSNDHLTELRNADVRYIEASGEAVPLESGRYDLVIMENCIDHVKDPAAVMAEIWRLLVPEGFLYLTVNGRSRPGYYVHRLLARLALDPGHPHTFTEGRFQHMLKVHGFDILDYDAGSWASAWRDDLISSGLKRKAKGLLCVSEHLLSAVARKVER